MTEGHPTAEGDDVLTLQALIQARRAERGWSYTDLAARSDHQLTSQRWQQYGKGVRSRGFPEIENIPAIAAALEVDITTVVLAAAKTAGLDVSRRGPTLAQLLPAGTDLLAEPMRDAILTIIRAAVAESIARADIDEPDTEALPPLRRGATAMDWPDEGDTPIGRNQPPLRRNAPRRMGDRPG